MMLPGLAPELPTIDDPGGDDWYTPQWILDWLGPVALDPCWSTASLVKPAASIDLRRGEDGLTTPWRPVGDGVVFCNPPFSNTGAWLRRCRAEADRLGRVVVALVPALPGDGPWHAEVWGRAPIVGFIRGRVEFRDPRGRLESKGRGHALVMYGPDLLVSAEWTAIRERARRHPQSPVWVTEFRWRAGRRWPRRPAVVTGEWLLQWWLNGMREPMEILALDPGPTQTGWVRYDPTTGRVLDSGVNGNADVGDMLLATDPGAVRVCCEGIASYGMAVGAEVFDTCRWIGWFGAQAGYSPASFPLVLRREVKLHLCGSVRAKDANVRQALIDRFGGKAAAIGHKANPGPLYGVKSHAWAALGVAITAGDRLAQEAA